MRLNQWVASWCLRRNLKSVFQQCEWSALQLVSIKIKRRLWGHSWSDDLQHHFYFCCYPESFCHYFIFALPPFPRGFIVRTESGWGWETTRLKRGSSLKSCLHTDLCASNYQCVGVLSKTLGLRFLLFSSVYCGLCFKWDANVIYSAWLDALRENWALQGTANE